ncbi:phosphomethylpyrimidine synthase ThiC [Methanonatronarchaeum sp. AMET6-2]|uniref:phosphomethylpyrimidine synthase ThiC n=1 Tax=Methanonatronarchaeum sp. AMET6-2 TaxID=2933293 RepID=UPI00120DDCB9|nr:phosphomethylpyrimidine synthase ThiC [Methanonatronarchaeum sp. AMET6-2]RZN63355.1 MAG: phosphomethylpyrimidine synthase ThiC [Methanonatronarchaeia archaeon]UOY10585.1 phosphomethylpyrimidine synthase ThiC [Methanonatronarchaeum sp. AMET6-2]
MQIKTAEKGKTTEEIEEIAKEEGIKPKKLAKKVAKGQVVIPKNINREIQQPTGIGEGLTTKVNANIGTSPDYQDIDIELEKAKTAIKAGADTIMDLSLGENMDETLRKILEETEVPVGTVPIYQTFQEKQIPDITTEDIIKSIEKHGEMGVDFITIHSGITEEVLKTLENTERKMDIVSRGGSLISAWMSYHEKQNPVYSEFHEIIEIASRYDLTLSLGDGMRPGCIDDSTDKPQLKELQTLSRQVEACQKNKVQVMVEGPGHIPLNEIKFNIEIQKKLCNKAPFYVLGPIVTDIATGYDHIAGAIGGALAASAGADYLCYVTPAEHLCLPNTKDVENGVVATKIAAHAADISKGIGREKDSRMASARTELDWETQMENAIYPETPRKLRKERPTQEPEACSMCSDKCAIKTARKYIKNN